jgi:hypothetical protein
MVHWGIIKDPSMPNINPALLPHIVLGQDARVVEATKAHAGTPWRKRSRMEGDFGLEQVFEHPASRTWVKVLEAPGRTAEVIGIARRQGDLPDSQKYIEQALTEVTPVPPPALSSKLVEHLRPAIEEDAAQQALCRKWVTTWANNSKNERALRALARVMPQAVANQFCFAIQTQDASYHANQFSNAALQNMMAGLANNNFGLNTSTNNPVIGQAVATLVLVPIKPDGTGFSVHDIPPVRDEEDEDDEYYGYDDPAAHSYPEMLNFLLPSFDSRSRGRSPDTQIQDLLEAALMAGFIWDENLQKAIDIQTRQGTPHLTPGGDMLESAFEKAHLQSLLAPSAVPALKKRL